MNVNDIEINCCGCGACYNICPSNAIEMKINKEGFLVPAINHIMCIHCGKCEKVCPVINYSHENTSEPVCYAGIANWEIRQNSTSGGAFGVLSNRIFEVGGSVFGAAWREDFSVYHCEAANKEELSKFHGSKYLQSNTEKTYLQVKKRLAENKKVLYSGTPCQIAGLYGYLGEKNSNLITVEILCHGVPSHKVFVQYLQENYDIKNIRRVSFTAKEAFKWGKGVLVKYKDGKKEIIPAGRDSFFKGFHRNFFLNKACNACKFNSIPRQADLTIADFWQIENFSEELNDGLGTSMILVNNEHGKEFFTECMSSFETLQEVPLDFINTTVNKNVWRGFAESPLRKRFFQQFNMKNFNDNVEQCIEGVYDIGLVGSYSVANFGGAVTYYALHKLLKSLGYSVLMIDKPKVNSKKNLEYIYEVNPYEDYEIAPNYLNTEQMYQLNGLCDKFVVGSDQMFNAYIFQLFGKFASLNWVTENKVKVAIGASFGRDDYLGSENARAQLAYELKKFDAFSVREESGVNLLRESFGVDATWILDPIFLCKKEEILDIIPEKESDEPYIGGYILDPNPEKLRILQEIMKDYQLPVDIYGEKFAADELSDWEEITRKAGKIEERLRNIRDCHVFVTDSYHGMCLAILMNKPFVAIINEGRGKARFTSLQKLLGVIMVNDYEDYLEKKEKLKGIEWETINGKIEVNRRNSICWIENALISNKAKSFSGKDILEKRLRTYGNITQLGLKNGCTVQEIIDALPENSYMQQVQGRKGEPINDLPVEYGVLTIKKVTGYFVEVQFVQSTLSKSSPKLYIANMQKGKVDYWVCYAEEKELEETKKRVDELEKDVKFLIRKYAGFLED